MTGKERKKHRRLRAGKTPRHVEVEWRAVSTGPSAVRHGAIPVSHLKVDACAKCHSERRTATEDRRHPECPSDHGHRHAAQRQRRSGNLAGARQGLCNARRGGGRSYVPRRQRDSRGDHQRLRSRAADRPFAWWSTLESSMSQGSVPPLRTLSPTTSLGDWARRAILHRGL
jgi:hypothetical protein